MCLPFPLSACNGSFLFLIFFSFPGYLLRARACLFQKIPPLAVLGRCSPVDPFKWRSWRQRFFFGPGSWAHAVVSWLPFPRWAAPFALPFNLAGVPSIIQPTHTTFLPVSTADMMSGGPVGPCGPSWVLVWGPSTSKVWPACSTKKLFPPFLAVLSPILFLTGGFPVLTGHTRALLVCLPRPWSVQSPFARVEPLCLLFFPPSVLLSGLTLPCSFLGHYRSLAAPPQAVTFTSTAPLGALCWSMRSPCRKTRWLPTEPAPLLVFFFGASRLSFFPCPLWKRRPLFLLFDEMAPKLLSPLLPCFFPAFK